MISIKFNYPSELDRNLTVRRAIENAAQFIRDLWLARSPYASGAYAEGLRKSGSVRVGRGSIEVKNMAKHAAVVEMGFNSYNWGLKVLNSGKGVKVGADGNRYKLIHIDQKPTARTRAPGVATQVKRSFQRIAPIGMRQPSVTQYGGIRPYKSRRALQRPIKGGKPKSGTPQGFFVISEKAIRENPNKWRMPARAGRFLARDVQKEAAPILKSAIRDAVRAERNRQSRAKGGSPQWYRPAMATLSVIQKAPIQGGKR